MKYVKLTASDKRKLAAPKVEGDLVTATFSIEDVVDKKTVARHVFEDVIFDFSAMSKDQLLLLATNYAIVRRAQKHRDIEEAKRVFAEPIDAAEFIAVDRKRGPRVVTKTTIERDFEKLAAAEGKTVHQLKREMLAELERASVKARKAA